MRVIVFFDLPTASLQNRREYAKFRKYLIKNGFLMMQESVYTKLALNQTVSNGIMEAVRKHKPTDGLVQMLTITEKQYQKMEVVSGELSSDVLNTDERLLFI